MDYYYNVISQPGRNEVQIFEVADFTLINSIDFQEGVPKSFVWTKNDQSQDELVGLIKYDNVNELVYISPIIGITDRIPIDEDVDITDICISDNNLYGCFHGGIINLTTNKKYKPNKKFEMIYADADGKIYLSDSTKVYQFHNSRISEAKFHVESPVVRIAKADDTLVVVTQDGVAIENGNFIDGAVAYKTLNDRKFVLYADKVVVDEHIDITLSNVVDVVVVNGEYKFIYKSGNSVNSKILKLETQTVDSQAAIEVANGTGHSNINLHNLIPATSNVPADDLYKQIVQKVENSHDLIKVLEGTSDESTINSVVGRLSTEQQSLVVNTVVSQVCKSPLNSMNLSLWFKIAVSSNPHLISSIPPKKLSSFSKHLTASLDLLPDLLSIKGKLNLIKMQNHFKTLHIETDAVEDGEESIVIVNGENDDDEEDYNYNVNNESGDSEEEDSDEI